MKQFIIILLASLAVSCMQEQTLIVDFKGFEGNEVEVTIQDYSEYFAGRKSKLARTYDLHDGKLYLNLNLSQPRVVHISHLDYLEANGYINSRGCIELFLKEGDKVAVTAYNHKDHITTKVKGSKINADLSIYNNIIRQRCGGEEDFYAITKEFVSSYPDSAAAAFVLLNIEDYQLAKQLCDTLNESCFVDYLGDIKGHIATRAAMPTMASARLGEIAPDFTVEASTGEDFTLSSLRGKWVVLYFCNAGDGICSLGIPKMKQYYNMYKKRMEVVYIESEINPKFWRNTIKVYGLSWTNIYTEYKTLDIIYCVEDYPTKIIIRPDGIMHKYFNNEGEEFYREIDRIMR